MDLACLTAVSSQDLMTKVRGLGRAAICSACHQNKGNL